MNEFFFALLSKDVNRFPFPKDFKTKKEKKSFLTSFDFDKQFQAIYNLFETEKQKRVFLFKIYGAIMEDNLVFKYDKVTFYNPNHKIFDKLKKNIGSSNPFFEKGDFFIASVAITYNSIYKAKQDSIKLIKEELNYWNLIIGKTLNIEEDNYLMTKNFKTAYQAWGIPMLTNNKSRSYR